MYKKIIDPTVILNYLKRNTYKSLPIELWDQYLWFYSTISDILSKPMTGKSIGNIGLYACFKDGQTLGAACVKRVNGILDIILDAKAEDGIDQFIDRLSTGNSARLTVNNIDKANTLKNILQKDYKTGKTGFYTSSSMPLTEHNVKELSKGDIILFTDENCPHPDIAFDEGIRYFGVLEDGRIVSFCALCMLTAFRAEIISVETLKQSDRKKGYAKAVCSFALNEALKAVPVVTWTTDISNQGSCALAKALGFKVFYEKYIFRF